MKGDKKDGKQNGYYGSEVNGLTTRQYGSSDFFDFACKVCSFPLRNIFN